MKKEIICALAKPTLDVGNLFFLNNKVQKDSEMQTLIFSGCT